MAEVDVFEEIEQMLEMEQTAQKKGISEGKVKRIEFGKRKDFFPEEKLQEMGINPEDEVVAIYIETEWGEEIREVFRVSNNKRAHLVKYVIEYGKPHEGQKVTLKYDKAKGRWRVLL